MSRTVKVLVGAGAVVALAAVALWWFWLRGDEPEEARLRDRTSETVGTSETTAEPGGSGGETGGSDASSPDGTWKVVAGDEVWVGYRVDEKMGPALLEKTAVGRTPAVEGSMTISGTTVDDVTMTADLSQLTSDEDRRDRKVRGEILETETYPEATFVLTEPIDLGAPPEEGAAVSATAKGELTVHGVSKPVELSLDARWNGDTIDVAGRLEVHFPDFGIENPSMAGMLEVGDDGTMELQLTFERA